MVAGHIFKISMAVLLVCVVSALTGCASIVSGSTSHVKITSTPDNADFAIMDHDGKVIHQGKTPATVDLKTDRGYFKSPDYKVKFTKAGCPECVVPIKENLDGWYVAGNLGFGGLIGWVIVDPLTGSMWILKDTNLDLATGQVVPLAKPIAATK
jgi:hypothetical protein